ncbi:hypothetical protein BDY24DRAFT_67034 [Mrakia frigida]|uniref:uncharacterized protein n=1 Tax=Mrakia frigida TaxID=29902 RepID=UPI003FCC18D2
MPSQPTSPGLKSLPSLPIEMKRAILSFCDAPTLAQACLVSLSFLELATPFLYRDVVLHGLKHFEKLFYEEKPTSSAPHLDHLFSLSQLRSFTFLGIRNDAFTRYAFRITPARLPSSSPLRIKRLKVRFGRDDVVDEYGELKEDEPNPLDLFSTMMNLFDPKHVVFSSPSGGRPDQRHPFQLELEIANWTRVRSWSWSNVVLVSFLNFGSPFISTLEFFKNLPEASLSISFDIRKSKSRGSSFGNSCLAQLFEREWRNTPCWHVLRSRK